VRVDGSARPRHRVLLSMRGWFQSTRCDVSSHVRQSLSNGETRSEGGFAANKVSTAAVLDVFTKSNKGKTYYYYEVLTRTADGDEVRRCNLKGPWGLQLQPRQPPPSPSPSPLLPLPQPPLPPPSVTPSPAPVSVPLPLPIPTPVLVPPSASHPRPSPSLPQPPP